MPAGRRGRRGAGRPLSDVGLVVVSHSRALAEAAVALAGQMLQGADVALRVAAGLADGGLGTDATAILDAVVAADRGDGVVVLMDLGSAVLSAELALELLDDEQRERVVLSPAPLVEGLVAAAVAAAGGAARESVAAEALSGLAGKRAHLGADDPRVAEPEPVAGDLVSRTVAVADPSGLHARPAARLVRVAAGLSVRVELRNVTTGSGWVPATSLTQVSVLGALADHRLELRAAGAGARGALDAVASVLADPGQAGTATAEPVLAVAGASAGGPTAVAAAPGVALGPARLLRAYSPEVPGGPGAGPGAESERLERALAATRGQVRLRRDTAARELGEQQAAVFDAHLLMLEDEQLLGEARGRVAAGASAPAAWAAATGEVHAALAALADDYLRARAGDVQAVRDEVLRALLGAPEAALPAEPGVLVAADLTPAQAAALDPAFVHGVVLAGGSPTAHSAILARGRGIAMVVGAGPGVLELADGTPLALDGATGELLVEPDTEAQARLRRQAGEQADRGRAAQEHAAAPASTRDGVRVLVGANLGSVADARAAAAAGADLAGLVRTEFLFLERDTAPDVEEQEQAYRALADALGGRRLTLRTLDVGGDKPLAYLPVAPEANPFLGVRGLRLSLARPGLLADQLLAVVRVARDVPVSLMFPMVSTLAELVAARRVLEAAVARDGRGVPAGLQVGIMVEVPAAALKTAAFAPHVDFLSIGTNDLTQYALAAERGNPAVTSVGDPYDPGVLRLVDAVCRGAGRTLVAVCGELAADERAARLLVGLGVRELSVAPAAVPAVKQAVRALDLPAAAAVAARALDAADPDEVRALLV